MIKLKPCPFCGKNVKLSQIKETEEYYVECNCIGLVSTYGFKESTQAIEAWNKRKNT
jgi:Lar family restriction alleviation protein